MNFEKKARVFKALSEPSRLKILHHLLYKKNCVCICNLAKLIKKDQSVAFRHIQILKSIGLIKTNKHNKFLMCCLTDQKTVKKLIGD